MMGQRRARTWRLDMLPAPGETWWPVAVVESERKVAGEVLWRNGHMDRDWCSRASMVANSSCGTSARKRGGRWARYGRGRCGEREVKGGGREAQGEERPQNLGEGEVGPEFPSYG
jgi:hypothetical protein